MKTHSGCSVELGGVLPVLLSMVALSWGGAVNVGMLDMHVMKNLHGLMLTLLRSKLLKSWIQNKMIPALASVAQWIGHCSANQKVAGLIPGQGTCLGFRHVPCWGAYERQPIGVSLSH